VKLSRPNPKLDGKSEHYESINTRAQTIIVSVSNCFHACYEGEDRSLLCHFRQLLGGCPPAEKALKRPGRDKKSVELLVVSCTVRTNLSPGKGGTHFAGLSSVQSTAGRIESVVAVAVTGLG
jgi:hypothetical protein